MLKANVYCTLISSPRQVKAATSYGSWLIQSHNILRASHRISVKALKDETGGETSGFRGRSWDPSLEIEVPFEQRPVCNVFFFLFSMISLFMAQITTAQNQYEDHKKNNFSDNIWVKLLQASYNLHSLIAYLNNRWTSIRPWKTEPCIHGANWDLDNFSFGSEVCG